MPIHKDLKRLVRGRMRKTGESYTSARAHLLKQKRTTTPTSARADYANLAGRSEATLKQNTGYTWERWVKALDRVKAYTWPHRDIAKYVQEKYRINGWWSQTVTVGYERIKGLRARGQRRDGTYEVNKSRTFDVPVGKLFDAWADPDVRKRWLEGVAIKMRTATRPKTMRLEWADHSLVVAGFMAKGKTRSVVALAHGKVTDQEKAKRLKQYWSERLDALGEVLGRR